MSGGGQRRSSDRRQLRGRRKLPRERPLQRGERRGYRLRFPGALLRRGREDVLVQRRTPLREIRDAGNLKC